MSGWSGDTFAIAPDPAHRGRILAGATFYPPDFDYGVVRRPLGDIYASDDYGEHWNQVSISQPISGVVEFAYGPPDSQVVYAATEGTGLLKSTDGGSTWQSVSSWPGTPKIWSVVTDPNDRRIVYVHNPGDKIQNIYASPDAGTTWTPVTWGEGQGGVWTLRFTPPPTSTLYLGTLGGGLYRVSGGGQGWQRVAGVPGTGTVYALAAGRDGQRIVLYTGVSAGLAVTGTQSAGSGQSLRVAQGAGGAMGAGVYRLTTLLQLSQRVYLPTVVKAYTP